MKTNNQTAEKKKTLKAVIILILLFIVGGTAGFFMGFMSGEIESIDLTAIKSFIKSALTYATPILIIAVFAFAVIFSIANYCKCRKAFTMWDGEDDEYIEKVESKLDIIVSILTIGLILVYSLFAVYAYTMFYIMNADTFLLLLPLTIAVFVIFFATIFYNTIMQRACIQLIKKINPEKKGEALAVNFQKEWEQSMDEAQKLMLYETGYRTYKIMNHACLIAWMISTLGVMFGIGLWPVVIVSALWLTMTVTYSIYGYKIEHKNKKR